LIYPEPSSYWPAQYWSRDRRGIRFWGMFGACFNKPYRSRLSGIRVASLFW